MRQSQPSSVLYADAGVCPSNRVLRGYMRNAGIGSRGWMERGSAAQCGLMYPWKKFAAGYFYVLGPLLWRSACRLSGTKPIPLGVTYVA